MFETSLVHNRTAPSPRRAGIFAASLALHSAIIVAAIGAGVTNVTFPDQAPDAYTVVFTPTEVSLPPAIGTTSAPPAPQQPAAQPEVRREITAPPEVPAEIPSLPANPSPGADASTADAAPNGAGTGTGEFGRPDGLPGGVGAGEGPIGIPGGGVPLQPGGDVSRATVLRRVDPEYPPLAARIRLKGTVVVRCVIGSDGGIRDPEVVFSSNGIFNDAALRAVRQWRFAPGTLRGRPVDTWFELTVNFTIR